MSYLSQLIKLSESQAWDMHNASLNEAYPDCICNDASEILKKIDPIGYEIGFRDYCSNTLANIYNIDAWN